MKGELDSVKVELHCLKEPDYMMTLMSLYGTLERVGDKNQETTLKTMLQWRIKSNILN